MPQAGGFVPRGTPQRGGSRDYDLAAARPAPDGPVRQLRGAVHAERHQGPVALRARGQDQAAPAADQEQPIRKAHPPAAPREQEVK